MVQENLAGVMVIKSFGLEETQIERFEKQSAVYMDFGLREAWTRAQMIPVVGLGGGLALVGVIGFAICAVVVLWYARRYVEQYVSATVVLLSSIIWSALETGRQDADNTWCELREGRFRILRFHI